MKKIIVFILFFSFISVKPLLADTTATPQPTPIASNYTLPYPGLLPDNPLYTLKVFRDRLIGFFISDPLKKSQFDLLQADKRVEAGYVLAQQKPSEEDLVVSTISKGENYFSEAISLAGVAQKQGQDVGGQLATLQEAAAKHEELLIGLTSLMPSKKTNFLQQVDRVNSFEKSVASMSK